LNLKLLAPLETWLHIAAQLETYKVVNPTKQQLGGAKATGGVVYNPKLLRQKRTEVANIADNAIRYWFHLGR